MILSNKEQLSYDDLVLKAYEAIQIENYNDSIKYSDLAIIKNPKEPDAYGSRGIAYLHKGEKIKSDQDLKKTIDILNFVKNVVLNCNTKQELVEGKGYDLMKFTQYESNGVSDIKLLAYKNINVEIKHFEKLLQEGL